MDIAPAARELLITSLDWLRDSYADHRFFVERDLVWTLQGWLIAEVQARQLPLLVRSDHGVEPGPRRSLSADIALLAADATVPAAVAEFKYEPSHRRLDIDPRKLPVISWSEVVADAVRVRRWVDTGRATTGFAICVDEGGTFRQRQCPEGGTWSQWGTFGRADIDVWIHVLEI